VCEWVLLVDAREGREQRLRVVKMIGIFCSSGTHSAAFAGGALEAHAFVQLHCKELHDCVATLKEALALYRRALPSNHATILITITNIDSALGSIVCRHVDAEDYGGALHAASDALQFLKDNLPSNDVMVSTRL
jgi:hypothetical protein